jgi:hypothetical protein
MAGGFNFDDYKNLTNENLQLPGGSYDFEVTVCGGLGSSSSNTQRWNSMPNSLVTFNRFWLSYQNTVGSPTRVRCCNSSQPKLATAGSALRFHRNRRKGGRGAGQCCLWSAKTRAGSPETVLCWFTLCVE